MNKFLNEYFWLDFEWIFLNWILNWTFFLHYSTFGTIFYIYRPGLWPNPWSNLWPTQWLTPWISLLSALVLVELQNTCKKSWTEKCSKDPTYAIFLESWGFRDVKYDIPMCQYHSNRPQPIQLVATMQKKLFTSPF